MMHSNTRLVGLRYTRLYWFEDAFQRPTRGASLYKAVLVRGRIGASLYKAVLVRGRIGASLYKAVLVRGRIPTPRSRGFAIQGCTGSRTHSNAPLAVEILGHISEETAQEWLGWKPGKLYVVGLGGEFVVCVGWGYFV